MERRKDHDTRLWFDLAVKASKEDHDQFEDYLRQLVHRCYKRFDELADEALASAQAAAEIMKKRNITWEEEDDRERRLQEQY